MAKITQAQKRAIAVYLVTVAFILVVYFLFTSPVILKAKQYANISASNTTVYGYPNETRFASSRGVNISQAAFYCTSTSDCAKLYLLECRNNIPSQSVCINSNYSATYGNAVKAANNGTLCPMFVMEGRISCACISNSCAEIYSK